MNWLFYCQGLMLFLFSPLSPLNDWCNMSHAFIRFVRVQPHFVSCHSHKLKKKKKTYSLKPISRPYLVTAFIYTRLSCLRWFIMSQEMSPVWTNWHLLLLISGVWLPFAPAEISPYCVLNTASPKGRFNKSPFNGASPQNSFRRVEAVSRLRLCASA